MKIAIATVNAREDSDEVSIKNGIRFYDREQIMIIFWYYEKITQLLRNKEKIPREFHVEKKEEIITIYFSFSIEKEKYSN